MDIGNKIKLLRQKIGATQEQLGEKIGVSGQSISKWETGVTMPDITLLPILSSELGVTIDELFDLTAEQKKVASEMSKTGTRVYNFTTKREKKVNEVKVELINHLAEQLVNFGVKNLSLINAERQIGFSIGENDYELTLTQKRKKK